jgi:hypothetical protein
VYAFRSPLLFLVVDHFILPIEIGQSFSTFPLGTLDVVTDFGFSEDGDRLRYMVVRGYPVAAPRHDTSNDPRVDEDSGWLPWVRHPDGKLRPVETDGRVYLFVGDELRTMRVKMNEHTDAAGFSRMGSLDGIWSYLQRFKVPDVEAQ